MGTFRPLLLHFRWICRLTVYRRAPPANQKTKTIEKIKKSKIEGGKLVGVWFHVDQRTYSLGHKGLCMLHEELWVARACLEKMHLWVHCRPHPGLDVNKEICATHCRGVVRGWFGGPTAKNAKRKASKEVPQATNTVYLLPYSLQLRFKSKWLRGRYSFPRESFVAFLQELEWIFTTEVGHSRPVLSLSLPSTQTHPTSKPWRFVSFFFDFINFFWNKSKKMSQNKICMLIGFSITDLAMIILKNCNHIHKRSHILFSFFYQPMFACILFNKFVLPHLLKCTIYT